MSPNLYLNFGVKTIPDVLNQGREDSSDDYLSTLMDSYNTPTLGVVFHDYLFHTSVKSHGIKQFRNLAKKIAF